MTKLRRLRIVFVLLLTGTLVSLVLGELTVRASAALFYPRARTLHPTLGWALNPSVERTFHDEYGDECRFVTNRWGHTGGPVDLERGTERRRVLFLGDSFTEGFAVDADEVFTHLLQERIPGLEAINTGVACYGTVQQFIYLRDQGLRFRPDHVVLMFFENDLDDNTRPWFLGMGARPYAVLADEQVRIVEGVRHADYMPFCLPVYFREFLYQRSQLYQSLNQKAWQPSQAEALAALDERTRPELDPREKRTILLELLRRMRVLLEAEDIALTVALIPRREHVGDPLARPYVEIEEGCAALGIPTISLLESLRDSTRAGQAPYFDVNMHWTREGHDVVARELAKRLGAP